MHFSKVLIGLASTVPLARAASDQSATDLGSVLAGEKQLSTYYKLIKRYPDILLQLPSYDGVTIMAPSNDAFNNIPYTALNGVWNPDDKSSTVPLLQYHILQGTVSTNGIVMGPTFVKPTLLTNPKFTNVTAGQNVLVTKQPDVVVFETSMGTRCSLVKGDIPFQGGLIQIVDNLLVPPARILETFDSFKLQSLLGAFYQAKLMPALADRQNITIFAPKSQALENIGDTLGKLDAKEFARVMGYHVVPNQVIVSSSLNNNTFLPTLAKDGSDSTPESIEVRHIGNNVYINTAQIVQPDILLANGIMHIISDVLNPELPQVVPNGTSPTQAPVFAQSAADGMPFTTAIPCSVNCPVTQTPVPTEATTVVYSQSSHGLGAARPTANAMAAGAVLGVMGLGAGMAML